MYAISINFADQRYCHNLFKMMKWGKGEKLSARIFYPARLSFTLEENLKNYRQAKVLSANKPVCKSAKWTSLSRKKIKT